MAVGSEEENKLLFVPQVDVEDSPEEKVRTFIYNFEKRFVTATDFLPVKADLAFPKKKSQILIMMKAISLVRAGAVVARCVEWPKMTQNRPKWFRMV